MTHIAEKGAVREWSVSVLLADPPHAYASNPRLTVLARTTQEIYDLVAERYPSGVVMGIWPKKAGTRVLPPGKGDNA